MTDRNTKMLAVMEAIRDATQGIEPDVGTASSQSARQFDELCKRPDEIIKALNTMKP